MFAMSKTVRIVAAGLGTALLLALGACGEPAEEETQGSLTPPATEQTPATVAQGMGEQKPAQQ